MRALESQPPRPDLPVQPKSEEAPERPLERAWRCAACGRGIASDAARTEVGGRHVHMRLNPHAYAFIFGCFSSAPGCGVAGTPTDEATWFAGCWWQFAHCGGCGVHLGWAFGGAQRFFGLVLERLVAPDGAE